MKPVSWVGVVVGFGLVWFGKWMSQRRNIVLVGRNLNRNTKARLGLLSYFVDGLRAGAGWGKCHAGASAGSF